MIFRSLYPARHRMGQSGWISSECALIETSRTSKYFMLTAGGEMELDDAENSFEQPVKGLHAMLRYA
jgi:PadR family transcriptional regulator PadR